MNLTESSQFKKENHYFSKVVWMAVSLIILASSAFLFGQYLNLKSELRQTQTLLQTQKTNDKVLDFLKFFIREVLNAQGEVNFDTRLKLETAVRNLGDEEILNQWQKFVESKTETEVQGNVKTYWKC